MNILIAGGTGFVGKHLTAYLIAKEHQVTVLTRSNKKTVKGAEMLLWDGENLESDNNIDLIINLCGQDIGKKRWSKAVKNTLVSSRITPTKAIVTFIKNYASPTKPTLLNASAIGFYPSSQSVQTESHIEQTSKILFSQNLVSEWESCAREAAAFGAQVSCLRFGVILGENGGMLSKVLPPFKFALGSVMGNPEAYLSWVHINDVCRAILLLLTEKNLKPAYNITSPSPCKQIEFTKALASACQRPYFLRVPSRLIKLIFGQLGEELLLADQKILPENLLTSGFKHRYQTIESAAQNIISSN